MADMIPLRAYLKELDDMLEHESPTEVVSHCRYILQHFPQNVAAHRLLAQALLQNATGEGLKEHFAAAAEVFTRVLSAVPNDSVAHLGLGEIREAEGALDAAVWHLERAYEQLPGNPFLQESLRRVLAKRDGDANVPQKIQLTRAALARQHANAQLYDQALVEVRRALEQSPGRLDLLVLLAEILWDSGHAVEAGEVAIQVLKKLPHSLVANRIMAQLWLEYERPSDARPFLEALEALDPYEASAVLHTPAGGDADGFELVRLDYRAAAQLELASDAPEWVHELGDLDSGVDMQRIFMMPADETDDNADISPVEAPSEVSPTDIEGDRSALPDWFAASYGEATGSHDDQPAALVDWNDDVAPDRAPDEEAIPDWFAALGIAAPAPTPNETPDEHPAAEPMGPGTSPAGASIEANWLLDDEGVDAAPVQAAEVGPDWWTDAETEQLGAAQRPAVDLADLLAGLAEDYDASAAGDPTVSSSDVRADVPAADADPQAAALPDTPLPGVRDMGPAEPHADDSWAAFEPTREAAADSNEQAAEGEAESTLTHADGPEQSDPSLPDQSEPKLEISEHAQAEEQDQAGVPGWVEDLRRWGAGNVSDTSDELPADLEADWEDPAEDAKPEPGPGPTAAVPPADLQPQEQPPTEGAATSGRLPDWLSDADLLDEPAVGDWLAEYELAGAPELGERASENADESPPVETEEINDEGLDEVQAAPDSVEAGLPDWLQLPIRETAADESEDEAEAPPELAEESAFLAQTDDEEDDWLRSFVPPPTTIISSTERTDEDNVPTVPEVTGRAMEDDAQPAGDHAETEDIFIPVVPEITGFGEERVEAQGADEAAAETLPADDTPASLADLGGNLHELKTEGPGQPPEIPYDPYDAGSVENAPKYATTRDTGILQPDEQPDWMRAFTGELPEFDSLDEDEVASAYEPPAALPAADSAPESSEPPMESTLSPEIPAPVADTSEVDGAIPAWLAAIASAEDNELDAALFGDLRAIETVDEAEELAAEIDIDWGTRLDTEQAAPSAEVGNGEPFDLLMDVAADIAAAAGDDEAATADETGAALDLTDIEEGALDALNSLEAELAALAEAESAAPAEGADDDRVRVSDDALDALSQLEADLAAWELADDAVFEEPGWLDLSGVSEDELDALSQLEAELAATQWDSAEELSTADAPPDRGAVGQDNAAGDAAAEDFESAGPGAIGLAGEADLADTMASAPEGAAGGENLDAEPVPQDFSFGALMPLWLRRPLEAGPSARDSDMSAETSERPLWLRDVTDDAERP